MVNLEKMLRQLMESQLQRAEGQPLPVEEAVVDLEPPDRKSTRLNSSH